MGDRWDGIKSGAAHNSANRAANRVAKNINATLKNLTGVAGGEEHIDALKGHADTVSDSHAAYKAALKNGAPEEILQTRAALNEAAAGAQGAIKAGKSHVSGLNSFSSGQKFGRVVTSKPALIMAGLAAAVGAASWVSNKRSQGERDSSLALQNQQTDSMRSEVASMKSDNTMMGMEPVVGNHASKVVAARSGAMGGIDATNPIMHSSPDGKPIEIVRS